MDETTKKSADGKAEECVIEISAYLDVVKVRQETAHKEIVTLALSLLDMLRKYEEEQRISHPDHLAKKS